MTEDNKKRPLEIEAKWAPTWEPGQPDEAKPDPKNFGERVLKYCRDRFDGANLRREAPRLPWRERFRHLPLAMVKAIPAAFSMLLIFYMGLSVSIWLSGENGSSVELSTHLRLFLGWMLLFCLLLGWKTASYYPNALKVTPKKILRAASQNWLFFCIFGIFLLADDAVQAEGWAAFGTDVISFIIAGILIFGVADLKLYKDELPSTQKTR
ncbi:MAG: hypothetical protein AAF903_11640 [Pseudomonadota bacterium]